MEKKFWLYLIRQMNYFSNKELIKIITYCNTYNLKFPLEDYKLQELLSLSPEKYQKMKYKYYNIMNNYQNFINLYQKDFFITIDNSLYPNLLKEIYNPPAFIFYQGNIDLLNQRCLGMIGSRKAQKEVLEIINYLLPDLIKNKFIIVSGLAKGVDTWSHQRCIYYKGKTIAVVGNGLDYSYPSENYRLQNVIAKHHLLISEYPMNTKPKKYHFPLRNRIIAGISEGICVLQSGIKSGTEITANFALEEGREVFAIPYNPINQNFKGCNKLIQEGAQLILSSDDIINNLTK